MVVEHSLFTRSRKLQREWQSIRKHKRSSATCGHTRTYIQMLADARTLMLQYYCASTSVWSGLAKFNVDLVWTIVVAHICNAVGSS